MRGEEIKHSRPTTFSGRVSARHCRDFSPEKLKEIYNKARLRVLT